MAGDGHDEVYLNEPGWVAESLKPEKHGSWPLERLRAGKQGRLEAHASSHSRPYASNLCQRCRLVDFEYLFFGSITTGYRKNLTDTALIGTLDQLEESAATGCPLCNGIFLPVVGRYIRQWPEYLSKKEQVEVVLLASDYASRVDLDWDARDHGYSAVRISIRLLDHNRETAWSCPNGLLQLRDHPLSRYRVVKGLADLELCKDWLSTCVEDHEQCRTSPIRTDSKGGNFAFKLIDVDKRLIIQVGESSTAPYAALSYVCGPPAGLWKLPRKSNLWEQNSQGLWTFPLPDNISSTVADAMHVAKAMNLQYLWVDSFCIAQDDPEELQSQIQQMHVVYSRAEICIVASSGKAAADGLPGVNRTRPEQSEQHVTVKDGFVVGCERPPLHEVLKPGVYMKRGWTFQELLLSRRCLLFTEHEMHYFCAGTTMCESSKTKTEEKLASVWTGEHLKVGRYYIANAALIQEHCQSGKHDDAFITWLASVVEYSTRDLSFQSDGLNAYQGLGLFIGDQLQIRMLYGSPETYLVNALRWHARVYMPIEYFQEPVRRQDNYLSDTRYPLLPTWTWASYSGVRRMQSVHNYCKGTAMLVMSSDLVPPISASSAMQKVFMTIRGQQEPLHRFVQGILPVLTKIAVFPVFNEDEEDFPYIFDIDVPLKFGVGARCESDANDWKAHEKKIACIQLFATTEKKSGPVHVLMVDIHELPKLHEINDTKPLSEVLESNGILSTARELTYQAAEGTGKYLQPLPQQYEELAINVARLQRLPEIILATRAGVGSIDINVWLQANPKDALVLLG